MTGKKLRQAFQAALDMKPLLADASLTAPDYDFSDFTAGGIRWATQGDGRMDTLPLSIDPWMIYWNKELFAAKGMKYPQSFDEMVDTAKKLNRQKCSNRGVKNLQ